MGRSGWPAIFGRPIGSGEWNMPEDYTQHQSVDEQWMAEQMSLQAVHPPGEVPGYRIEQLLGRGAYGQVWVGTNLNTGAKVAVKFYLHREGVDWSLLSREVKHMVRMSANRFIVQILEVGWASEPPYYVMEYLENGSLEELIRVRGRLHAQEAVGLIHDIARGLNHLHGRGILHCDLKPANILLDAEWRPRLADFGQSRTSAESTASLGTPFYMAPEQADLNAIPDAQWDVYAMGAILYCMLVGYAPHRTDELSARMNSLPGILERLALYREHLSKQPPPREHHRVPGVDKELATLVDRCLALRPEDRFANVQQVLESLERRRTRRSRLPLLLFGLIGPLLMLMVMGFFSSRGIGLAQKESTDQLTDWSLRSNAFAAALAARSLENELERLLRRLSDESRQLPFWELLDACQNMHQQGLVQLAQQPGETTRPDLNSLDPFQRLQRHVDNRLKAWSDAERRDGSATHFSSLLVLDRTGTNIAAAIDEPIESSPVGKNFAYRSYFHGGDRDLDPAQIDRTIEPMRHPHITPPFASTSTGRWKLALAIPLVDPAARAEQRQVRGVLALTINLGEFPFPGPSPDRDASSSPTAGSSASRSLDRFAVLLSALPGPNQGMIVEHPYLRTANQGDPPTPETRSPTIPPTLWKPLRSGGITQYVDPFASREDGTPFQGRWIAAMEPVRVAITTDPDRPESEFPVEALWVLVQERADLVTNPVQRLGERLRLEGIVALLSFLAVLLTLWLAVFRMLRANRVNAQDGGNG